MKKFINPIPLGGMPVHTNRFQNELNIEIWSAIESIIQGVSDPSASGNVGVIVSGVKVTGGGPYNISSGIVYLSGQFMYYPGASGVALPQYVLPATLVNISKVFADGASKNLITQQDAVIQSGVPGGGQYITLSTTGNLGGLGGFRFENWVSAGVLASVAAEAALRISGDSTVSGLVTAEAGTRASADSTLQTNINTEITNRTNADTALQNSKLDEVHTSATPGFDSFNTPRVMGISRSVGAISQEPAGLNNGDEFVLTVSQSLAGVISQQLVGISSGGTAKMFFRRYSGSWSSWTTFAV